MKPKVTVLMSCKNSNPELLEMSIKSVLNQSFRDFEFVAVIDDSSDYLIEPLIHSFSNDNRIKVLHIPSAGLGDALNYGINNSTGQYIARTDDDDIMASDRLKKQVDYLDNHPEVSCVGSQRYSYTKGKYIKHRLFPTNHEDIVRSMLNLKWSMAHTALMYRRSCVNKIGNYRVKGCGEDVDLILQLGTVGKLANLEEYLIYYYLGMNSLSTKNNIKQLDGHLFALEDIKKRGCYAEYDNLINSSIEKIKNRMHDTKKKLTLKRWLLLEFVNCFGKKLPNDF